MLSKREIERISETLTEGNRGYTEKLYLQDIILSTISSETVDEIVFKGGTALLKFYQLDRFSEDLDFTAQEELDFSELVKKIVRDLENHGAEVEEREDEEKEKSFKTRLGVKGPLYTGDRRSLNFIRIEINRKSSVQTLQTLRYNPHFQDLASFELLVLSEEEILAEKIRAVLTRTKPRDLYDIYHLLSKGVEIREELVEEKLECYELDFEPETILERAERLEKNWGILETLTYSEPPEFETALQKLEEGLRNRK